MKSTHYRPSSLSDPNSLIIAPYPFVGTEANTGARCKYIAEKTGMVVLGYTRFGAGRTKIFDLSIRKALKPPTKSSNGRYASLRPLEDTSAALQDEAQNFEQIIGLGDSTGGIEAKALTVMGFPFTKLLLRDATNLKSPQPPVIGQGNYFAYQLLQERKKASDENSYVCREGLEPPDTQPVSTPVRTMAAMTISEVFNYGPLWRSEWDKDNMRTIAAEYPRLPVMHIGLEHSFTATLQQSEAFVQELTTLRSSAGPDKAPLDAFVEYGMYHSDLEHPDITVKHLRRALIMEDAL